MAKTNKTVETNNSVTAYLNKIKDEAKRKDCIEIAAIMKKISGAEQKMWGTAIVGCGSYHYKYESGREGDAPLLAFSSRATSIVLYIGREFAKRKELLTKLGKHKVSGGCVHIKKLSDIDTAVLSKLLKNSFEYTKKNQHC